MTKIVISLQDKSALAAARKAGMSRTAIWSAIRYQYGIPSYFKLAVTCVGELYVKGTDPKQYLHADPRGKYAYSETDVAVAGLTPTPVSSPAQVAVADSRFVVAEPKDDVPASDWSRVSVEDVLYTMRDVQENVDDGVDLPAGFPKGAGRDALVVDSKTGHVYFRT